MSKQPNRTGNISKQDIRTWTEYLATGQIQDEAHKKELSRLSKRTVNLADVATIVDFMARRNDGYISSLIEQNALYEKVLRKLGATDELFTEAKEDYNKELAQFNKEIEEATKALSEGAE